MDTRFDPLRIAASLRSHGVTYVLVGDIAAAAHGSTVETDETEILLPEDDENLERLGLALIELGASPVEGGAEHRSTFDTQAGRLNLIETERVFEELAADAVEVDLGRGVVARVASVDHMSQLQRESGDLIGATRLAALGGAEFRKDDDDDPRDVAAAGPPRFRDKIWGALESVDSFLTDLDSRGIRSPRR
jgi:plasmid stability protein